MNCTSIKYPCFLSKEILFKIYRLAHMCELSYSNPENIKYKPILNDLLHTLSYIDNKETDAQCYIMNSQNTIYVCFRGTSTIKDAITDLCVMRKKFISNNIYVHKGFYNQFMSIKNNIENKISNIIKNNNTSIKKICFTGHSLGGGLATLGSLYFKNKYNYLDVECFTFGSPRVGNTAFIKSFNEKIKTSYRISHNNDPIQYVPMSPLYHHIHYSLCIMNNNEFVYKKPVKGYYRFFNTLKNLNYSNIVEPHHIKNYIEHFENEWKN